LATVRSQNSLNRFHRDEALARRVVVVHVPSAENRQVAAVLHELASSSAVEVVRPVITAAVRAGDREGAGQPAAALGLLGAAMAKARWGRAAPVGPDDLFDVLKNQRPEDLNPEE
jgi:hypothetical protein